MKNKRNMTDNSENDSDSKNSITESNKKDYILFFAILFMGIEKLIEFEKVAAKTSPYLPMFIFGYIFYLTTSNSFLILFLISLVISSYYLIWKEDKTVNQIKDILFLNKNQKENIHKLAMTKRGHFYFKALISFIMFVLQLTATIFSGYYAYQLWNLYLGIFFILSAFVSIFILLNLKKITIASFNIMKKIKEQHMVNTNG